MSAKIFFLLSEFQKYFAPKVQISKIIYKKIFFPKKLNFQKLFTSTRAQSICSEI